MGLLEQVIGGVLGSRMGSGSPMGGQAGGSSGMSPLMIALMSLLASQASQASQASGQGGGLGGLLGGAMGQGGSMGQGGGMGGGLGGLVDSFQRSGHGDVLDSWMGSGPNRDISPSQLNEALGSGTVDGLSRQTGMPQGELLAELSRMLPGVVDGVTPHGRMPEQHEIAKW